jgi:tetratricopeptide (TPR) repeat protein
MLKIVVDGRQSKPIALRLREGLAEHQAGRLESAKEIYLEILKYDPSNFGALHMSGLIDYDQGRPVQAIKRITQAITLYSGNAIAQRNLGMIYQSVNRHNDALECLQRALTLKPEYVEAKVGIAISQKQLRQPLMVSEKAKSAAQKAFALADSHRLHKRHAQALDCYEEGLCHDPLDANAYCDRGVVLFSLGRNEQSIQSTNRAIEINPNLSLAYSNRALVEMRLKQFELALASLQCSVRIDPRIAETHLYLGNVFMKLNQSGRAIEAYGQAISLRQGFSKAHLHLGIAQMDLLLVDDAIASYKAAIASDSELWTAHYGLAVASLLQGDFDRGWPLYESRWKLPAISGTIPVGISQHPHWDGATDIAGRTILIHSEQGYGDTLQFCRYIPLVAQRGANIVVKAPQALVELLQLEYPFSLVVSNDSQLPPFDVQCPLLSLPLAFGTTEATIPSGSCYLHSHVKRRQFWHEKLKDTKNLRVGIAWSGSPNHKNDEKRNIRLEDLLPYLPKEHQYVSLQYEIRPIDLNTLQANPEIVDLHSEIKDFTDTAALCDLLDAVICVDTSIAHLSGALGKATFVLLPFNPDWRWQLNRSDSPWYPSVKLLRQLKPQDWGHPLRQIGEHLSSLTLS